MSENLSTWVEHYVTAWTSNDAADIRKLFTDDAVYNRKPNDPGALVGIESIVEWWSGEAADEPGAWTFEWWPVAETEAVTIAQNVTTYQDADTWDNTWFIEFAADGRARRFTEWAIART